MRTSVETCILCRAMTAPRGTEPNAETRDPSDIGEPLTSHSRKLSTQICGLSALGSGVSHGVPCHRHFAESHTDWKRHEQAIPQSQNGTGAHFHTELTAPTQDVSAKLVSPGDIEVQDNSIDNEGERPNLKTSNHFLLQKLSDNNLSTRFEELFWSPSPESLPDEDDGILCLTPIWPRKDVAGEVTRRLLLQEKQGLGETRFGFQTPQNQGQQLGGRSGKVDRASNETMQPEKTPADAFNASLDNLARIIEEMAKLARTGCSREEDKKETKKAPEEGANVAQPRKLEERRPSAPFDIAGTSKSSIAQRGSSHKNTQLHFPAFVSEKLGCATRRMSSTLTVPSRPKPSPQKEKIEPCQGQPTGLIEIGSSQRSSSRLKPHQGQLTSLEGIGSSRPEPRQGQLTGLEKIGSFRHTLSRLRSSHGSLSDHKSSSESQNRQSSSSRPCFNKTALESSLLRLDKHDRNRFGDRTDKTREMGAHVATPKKTMSDSACDNESSRNKRWGGTRSSVWESAPANFSTDEEWPANLGHRFKENDRAIKEPVLGRRPLDWLKLDRETREAIGSQRIWCFADSDGAPPRDANAQRRAEMSVTSIGGNPDEPFPLKASSVRLVGDPVKAGQRLCNVKVVCIISPASPDSPVNLPSRLRRARAAGSSCLSPVDL